jgi:Protein of unknown function (DUF3604)
VRRAAALASMLVVAVALAGAAAAFERTETREPCSDTDPLRRPFFGDLHVHTTFSFDAWGQGTRNTPRDAYRFARGEAVGVQPYDAEGHPLRTLQLRRPLDFAAVTDHAELLGETFLCRTPGAPGYDSLVCTLTRRWPRLGYMIVNGQMFDVREPVRYSFCGPGGERCLEAGAQPWREIRDAAEAFYDRSSACSFTTFLGYEWSGNPDGNMIHRNVIFRNAIAPERPANYVDDKTPEVLWRRLRAECLDAGTGCDVVVIPHNPNLSGGLLFRTVREDGAAITGEDALRRSQLEVLLEVTQHKGDSECRAGNAEDELCSFETLPYANMRESALPEALWTAPPPLSYAREILAEGLAQEERVGENPFRLGLIGSTDTHLGAPGSVDEDRFVGHAAGTVTSRLEIPPLPDSIHYNPGGLAVLWAEENSRDALFAAMRRREAYGTSGPRIEVRFFGGWAEGDADTDWSAGLCRARDFAARGYARGVPMGADLPARPDAGPQPVFAVRAKRDPGARGAPGTALQRVQIVKLDVKEGRRRERVFEVAGDPGDGADVDLTTCTPRGRGFDELCGVWRDPEFDPAAHALYYARVVENPSCRWSQWVCNARRVDCNAGAPPGLEACCDPDVPKTVQERAWTSPIWYAAPRQDID